MNSYCLRTVIMVSTKWVNIVVFLSSWILAGTWCDLSFSRKKNPQSVSWLLGVCHFCQVTFTVRKKKKTLSLALPNIRRQQTTENANEDSRSYKRSPLIPIKSNVMFGHDASKNTVPTTIFLEDKSESYDVLPIKQETQSEHIRSPNRLRLQNCMVFCVLCAALQVVIVVCGVAYFLLWGPSRGKGGGSTGAQDNNEFPVDPFRDMILFNSTLNPSLPHANIFNTSVPWWMEEWTNSLSPFRWKHRLFCHSIFENMGSGA